ncbi:MAG: hypothetical protein JJ863_25800 [Deltaproteobacteria bacterium]|nr:hypothetical protein [Deltaproteobacteria bacterium]
MSARDERRARMLTKLAPHERPAWRAETETGDQLDASKLGGTPIAGAPIETVGLRMLVQLRGEDLPEELGFPGDHIVQLFWSRAHYGSMTRGPAGGDLAMACFPRPSTIEARDAKELPARRLGRFERFDDRPRWADLQNLGVRLNAKEMRIAQEERPEDRLKLGGWPDWIQHADWPGDEWRLLLQLHGELAGVDFGDTGLGYLLWRPGSTDLAFGWSST